IRYCPEPSVVAVRTFSMSAGLAASTVTPGRTAPEASLTTPEIDAPLCAAAVQAVSSTHAAAPSTLIHPRIWNPPWRASPTLTRRDTSIPRRHKPALRSVLSPIQVLTCIHTEL